MQLKNANANIIIRPNVNWVTLKMAWANAKN